MQNVTQIQEVMTLTPHTIGSDIPVIRAEALMREQGLRHLPVLAGGRLVGIISDRDITLAAALGDSKTKVEDVMTPDPYVVTPDTPLARVAAVMAKRKYGSAVIQRSDGKVIGIFTGVDGLRVLAETLADNHEGQQPKSLSS